MKYIIWMMVLLVWMPCMAAASKHTTTSKSHHHAQRHKKITSHRTHAAKKSSSHKKNKIHHHTKHHTNKKKKLTVNRITQQPVQAEPDEASLGGPIKPIISESASYSSGFVTSFEHKLVEFVRKTVSTAQYTAYKLGGRRFDASHGVYVLDCSDYVDNVLAAVHPKAYWSLADSAGSDKPTSQHYYEFFSELGQYPNYYWDKVNDVDGLQPGDILVFRKKNGFGRHHASGHVMVVMNKPVQSDDAYFVRVADSAPVGHSQDTRPGHTSGIGIGTLLLKVNPRTGKPFAYAWKVGSRWTANVNIAMARPIGA